MEGKFTGTYRFTTEYYGLTVMSPEFLKLMNITLANINSIFAYMDDALFVTEGTTLEPLKKVKESINVLDEANLQLKAEKYTITQDSIEWLGIN